MIGIGVDCVLHGCEMQPGVGSEHQQPGPAPTKIADIFRHRIGRESEMAPEHGSSFLFGQLKAIAR